MREHTEKDVTVKCMTHIGTRKGCCGPGSRLWHTSLSAGEGTGEEEKLRCRGLDS